MYNRYVPQSDGSFQRCRMQDPGRQENRRQPAPPPPEREHYAPPPPPVPPQRPCPNPKPQPPRPEPQGSNVLSFFRQLLPRDFDTGDLLVVLLLLLMAGDCQEDQNTALLTLALYLFM